MGGAADPQLLYDMYPEYRQILRLITVDSQNPDAELKRAQARDTLTRILSELGASECTNPLWIAMVKSTIACLLVDSVLEEQVKDAERILVDTVPVLEKFRHVTSVQLIQSLISLAVVRYQQADLDQAKAYLERAEALSNPGSDLVRPDSESKVIDRCNTQVAFLLAQVYNQSSEPSKAALYCHKTLQQQILLQNSGIEFDAGEWASNCIKLSAFYSNINRLRQAKYCIDVAMDILAESQVDENHLAKADISCALAEEMESLILDRSADLYQNKTWNDLGCINTLDEFTSVSVPTPACFQIARNMQEAQAIVCQAFLQLQTALSVYTLDGFVTDHIVLVQKASALFKDATIFSDDHAYCCKLHKKRIDLLEPVVRKLNPKIYSEFVGQLLSETAQAYCDMAESKFKQMSDQCVADSNAARVNKFNFLTAKAIHHFQMFLRFLRENKSMASEERDVHVELKAKFQVAGLYSRFIYSEHDSQIAAVKSSLDEYEDIARLCRMKAGDGFQDELNICHEMCSLLTLRMHSLIASTTSAS